MGRVVCPVGAGGFPEAEKSACLLVDPLLAFKGVSPILHIFLNDTPWEWGRLMFNFYHLSILSHQQHVLQFQIEEQCDHRSYCLKAPL